MLPEHARRALVQTVARTMPVDASAAGPSWRQIVKSCITSGLRRAVRDLGIETFTLFRHMNGRRLARHHRHANGLRLNLGCGSNRKTGWLNIDLAEGADLTLDLREPLPFRDGSCEAIYTEHFLEHVDYPADVLALLSECFRVLAPGGRISIGVPDTRWPLLAYAGVDGCDYFEQAKSRWHPAWCQTRMEHINFHFRQSGEHRFAYDFETLAHVLKQTKFVDIVQRPFTPALDSERRAVGTLYVDARKPSPKSEMTLSSLA